MVRDHEFLLCQAISSYNNPPSTPPPVGIVLVFPRPHPPLSGSAHLWLGRNWSGMVRESSETRSPSPIRSLDPPPPLFFQGFRLAKLGLIRAAFIFHHHQIHNSSCCFPTSVSEVLNLSITLHLTPQGPKGLGPGPHATLVSPSPLWLPFY